MISKKVHDELMSVQRVLHFLPASPSTENGWTPHERQLFWAALDRFPRGPWTDIAEFIGTKSIRQAMTHGQKLRQKFKRWVTRLRRHPTARSLVDGVTVASTLNLSVTTESSATVVPPSSHTIMTPALTTGHGRSSTMKVSTFSRSNALRDSDAVCVVPNGKREKFHQENEGFSGKSSSDVITMQTEEKIESFVASGDVTYASTNLQMLFEPQLPAPVASTGSMGETKYDDENDVPHPICEIPIPQRNLLDELADVLWNKVGQRK